MGIKSRCAWCGREHDRAGFYCSRRCELEKEKQDPSGCLIVFLGVPVGIMGVLYTVATVVA